MKMMFGDLLAARPVVNLFRTPSDASEVTSQALYGWCLRQVDSGKAWIKVRTEDDYEGWVRADETVPWKERGELRRVAQLSANVYRQPDLKRGAPLLNLPWESRLEVEHRPAPEGWLCVALLDGQRGFVHAADLGELPVTPLGWEAALALGHRFLGITYTWGGMSSYGFDCSGFVQMIFRQCALFLPRDAQAQAAWEGFEEVSGQAEPIAGEALFFGDSLNQITHVGLALGAGNFLHDTPRGVPGVQVSKLSDKPWSELLVARCRVRQ